MMYNSRVLFLIAIGLFSIWSTAYSLPIIAKLKSNERLNRYFVKGQEHVKPKSCGQIVSGRIFPDQVMYVFITTGNVEGLDQLLNDLVELKCYTSTETDRFRMELKTIYNLMKNNKMSKRGYNSDDENEDRWGLASNEYD